MFASPTAMWLNSFFAGYDHLFLKLMHGLEHTLGFVLTPLMKLVTLLGEKGLIFFLLALIFLLCADRRDLGVCIFGAVCCGALITNILLKDNVARLRPFEASYEYAEWWFNVGSPAEDGFSFPSGHVTACAAGMTAITLMRGKKWLVPSVIIVLIMGISRNYLMAHYPSDVLFAAIIGVFSGFVAWFITQLIFRFLRRNRRKPACAAVLSFDVRDYLPFALPALPFGTSDGKQAAPRVRKADKAERAPAPEPAPEPLEGDEDVKTYRVPAREDKAPAAEAPAAERPARPARPAIRLGRRERPAETGEAAKAPRHVKGAEAAKQAAEAEPKAVPEQEEPKAAPEQADAVEVKAAVSEPAPARRVRVPAPSGNGGGRHAIDPGSSAKAKSGFRLPRGGGGYQGKHVK